MLKGRMRKQRWRHSSWPSITWQQQCLHNQVLLFSFTGMQTWIITVDENKYTLRWAWKLTRFSRGRKSYDFKSLNCPWTKTRVPTKTARVLNLEADFNDENGWKTQPCIISECKQTASWSLPRFVCFPVKRNRIQLTGNVNTKVTRYAL
jgi:hypothetical protein